MSDQIESLMIEFQRMADLTTGLLRKDDPYLLTIAANQVKQVSMPLGYFEFQKMVHSLRYEKSTPEVRAAALEEIGDIVAALMRSDTFQDLPNPEHLLQLDLVVNAAELAALPFESALKGGEPLLVRNGHKIVLTRRVRTDQATTQVSWPSRVRILFAWADAGGDIPMADHTNALRAALSAWIPMESLVAKADDIAKVFCVVAKASVSSITEACNYAVKEGMPFTHVHILAHGAKVGEEPDTVWGLALHNDADPSETQVARPDEIASALATLNSSAVVLSLAACDSGNETSPFVPRRSIAHELHVAGTPVVIASQFPLTKFGSTVLVKVFYKHLLDGNDVREALYTTRCELKQEAAAGHDWASVVAYVRLPETYGSQLKDVRLKAVLSSLGAVQGWTDNLVAGTDADPAKFKYLADKLEENICRLIKYYEDNSAEALRLENFGLLGSAEKRLSELYFSWRLRTSDGTLDAPMRAALTRSRDWYRRGCDSNLSHHWTGVQFLCLNAIVEGAAKDPRRWYAAELAAQLDRDDEGVQTDLESDEDIWACGSLAELYLLAPLLGLGDKMGLARDALNSLKTRVTLKFPNNSFYLKSTKRQLRRYIQWWTPGNGFLPGVNNNDLAANAGKLLELLDA